MSGSFSFILIQIAILRPPNADQNQIFSINTTALSMRTNTYIIETISTSPEAYEQMRPTLVLRYNFNIAPKKTE